MSRIGYAETMKRSGDNGDESEEAARVRALHDLNALDSITDARFDRIARLAALAFETPRAAVVLVDKDRLFLKGQFGVPATSPRTPPSRRCCPAYIRSMSAFSPALR